MKISTLAIYFFCFVLQGIFALGLWGIEDVTLVPNFVPSIESVVSQTDNTPERWNVVELLKDMAKIESPVGYEYNVMNWLAKILKEQGLTVEMQLVEDSQTSNTGEDRYNVYAYMGTERDTKIVVSSHIDTNPEGHIPYKEIGEEIHVRGACDAKGAAAGQIVAFFELWDSGKIKEGDVSLLFVIGEEYNGIGMEVAVKSLNATWSKAAILGEPTENKLSRGHKGNFRFDVEAWGKKSHSGYPELGFSAIEFLVRKLYTLLEEEMPYSDLLGPTTVNIGTIQGGDAANIVPDHVKSELYIRMAAEPEWIKQYAEELFNTEHSKLSAVQYLAPQNLDFDVPDIELISCAYATDMPYLEFLGIKRYLYGPGSISVAHTQEEFVTETDLYQSVIDYKKIIEYNI